MAQTDLYSLLKGFTLKTKSPYINVKEFTDFIERYAHKAPPDQPEWERWKNNTEKTFWSEAQELAESGKCSILTDSKIERIFVPAYCRKQIEEAYSDADRLAPVPFPNEDTLNFKIPEGHALRVNLNKDMDPFFIKTDEALHSRDIVLLQFPYSYGSALLLNSMIPRRLTEISLLKIRHFLHIQNNKDYALNKLKIQMPGKDKINRDLVEKIMFRPLDCLTELENTADFQYLFWTYFCSFVKNEVKKKGEMLSEDLAILQAVCIIEIFCSIYRNKETKKRDHELAFKALENNIDKAPWYYTLEDIVEFTNDRGIRLLDIYSQHELEEYIKKQITESTEGSLPPWFVIHSANKTRWFVKKERYLYICNKMLFDAQPVIKEIVTKRWKKIMNEFSKEKSMENEAAFEKLLESQIKSHNPDLFSMLSDPKLQWAFQDMNKTAASLHQAAKIFSNDGMLLPYSTLLSIRRRDLLATLKLGYPFWYSIPILKSIIIFFKRLGKPKHKSKMIDDIETASDAHKETVELKKSAYLLEAAMIPKGKSIDEYLSELADRWLPIIDKKASQNLIVDMQTLLRDNLRQMVKVYKVKTITRESLRDISEMLLKRHENLRNLKNQKDLKNYMEVYMIKILLSGKKL